MSKPKEDLTGKRFGKLVVIEPHRRGSKNHWHWVCRCDCGNVVSVITASLNRGSTLSCGCKREGFFCRHGMYGTPTHTTWLAMIQRCTNPNAQDYPNYGGRGIEICKSWLVFENFLADMGIRPDSKHSIDRIDVNGPYSKENCRWSVAAVQANNRRNSRYIEIDGESKTVAEWSTITGIAWSTLDGRLRLGWSPEDAVMKPIDKSRSTNNGRRGNL